VSLVLSEDRPVPLDQHVIVASKFVDLFDSSGQAATHRVNPELARLTQAAMRQPHARGQQSRAPDRNRQRYGGGGHSVSLKSRLDRPDVIEMLGERQLLPAIFFIFSRAGCDQAVRQCVQGGVRLTDAAEREEIREIVDERCRTLLDEDLGVLGYWKWLEGLERGVAAHHAGLLPAFKEVVEELFQRKLVKVVFATETLALGINMPARSVVLEKLEKFNGEARVPLTAGEYTQLTGRAGRRGIDNHGNAIVLWSPFVTFEEVANLAASRSFRLTSSFRPTYNMAANLVRRYDAGEAHRLLGNSFAQYQADADVAR
jgi:ATP-dependent RNA helicase HelY